MTSAFGIDHGYDEVAKLNTAQRKKNRKLAALGFGAGVAGTAGVAMLRKSSDDGGENNE